ncbi:ABC transporter ATP-binding protein [Williamsia sp. CHRR-6]|uniref:ABC transporter ATP-binding protein n=1 Tax=Williamsia sp. CHRR-6 TaxID=2835871 RepID=UPI001BDB284A|nr:ABC transporter ATP-binding protein [Williamsia sp. CHRR-6]MBT0566832.1 ABC transporter ATP-binding protein [Williamsia sp. CHRR-6]
MSATPLLSVQDLHVSFDSEAGRVDAVRGISFDLAPGACTAIVGESGSGKSVTSLAVMGLLPDTAEVSGSVVFDGQELLGRTDKQMTAIRGSEIAMIFQDPLSALTPVYTVEYQIIEALQAHRSISKKATAARVLELLELVGIPNPAARAKAFPHELSGGMRQRVVIAIAIANDPKLIIADEPTTALDVTIQAQVMDLLATLRRETGAGLMLITHDLGVVAGAADDVVVMYAGRAVERADAHELYRSPRMPYTVGLLSAIPRVDQERVTALAPIVGNPLILIDLPVACPFHPRCPAAIDECRSAEPQLAPVAGGPEHLAACFRSGEIAGDGQLDGSDIFPPATLPDPVVASDRAARETVLDVQGLTKTFPILSGLLKQRVGTVYAVNDISFDLKAGETLAIVGESGSGKTTTLLEVLAMEPTTDGTVILDGQQLNTLSRKQIREARKRVQIVFQDPMGSLNPRMTVQDIISEPLRAFGYSGEKMRGRVRELMELVGLDPAHAPRFPAAFSGGQRQRIGIARALAINPKLVVLDEPVSALDVSIQASVINLLDELKRKIGVSYLFVAHDLSVVRHLADRVAVMYLGRFVEVGDTDSVFTDPQHPYTRALLSAIPIPDPELERTRDRVVLEGDLPSPTDEISGCSFHNRCPLRKTLDTDQQQRCNTEIPTDAVIAPDHVAACHFVEIHSAATETT